MTELKFGEVLVDGVVCRAKCSHYYGMSDSCPGCTAWESKRHKFLPIRFMGPKGVHITRCRQCGLKGTDTPHKNSPKPRRAKNTNRQGANFELQVMHDLEPHGFDCLRSSGSRGKVDVVAVGENLVRDGEGRTRGPLLFIQCKITNPLISPAEREGLIDLARRAGALPVVAHRVDGKVHYRELTGADPKAWRYWFPVWCACGGSGCKDKQRKAGI